MLKEIIKSKVPVSKNITDIFKEVKKPMSLRQIINKYAVTHNFQVMVVRDILSEEEKTFGEIVVPAGGLLSVIEPSKKPDRYFVQGESGELLALDVDVKKLAYSGKL